MKLYEITAQYQNIYALLQNPEFAENEDILVHVVPRTQAYQWVVKGKIDNVIAVIGLQWLELNYKRYH